MYYTILVEKIYAIITTDAGKKAFEMIQHLFIIFKKSLVNQE